jgi:hypothetical protein
LASLVRDRELNIESAHQFRAHYALPATLNNFSLRFSIHDHAAHRLRSQSPSAA